MFGIESESFRSLADLIAGPSSRLYPAYLLATLAICAVIHRRRKISGPFLSWLVPRAIYLHASHIVDIKVFLLGRAIAGLGVLNVVVFTAVVAAAIAERFAVGGGLAPFPTLGVAILLMAVSDFATYWVHRVHHENRIIWPFHSLHHSAEVMTPITVYRKHPVYDLISSFVRGLLIGVLQGALLALFQQTPSMATIAGVNACYVLFNFAGSNLRHSHVWLSFGPALEHVFISPAQHQIHHSLAPRHHNKNYGEILAIWDWMFGTLYIQREMEVIEYGLGDREGRRLRQRHDSLRAAMLVPLKDSWRQIRKRLGRPAPAPAPAPVAEPEAPGAPAAAIRLSDQA